MDYKNPDLDELSAKLVGSECKKCGWQVTGYASESERRSKVLEHLRLHKDQYGFFERTMLKQLYKQFGFEF